MRVKLLKAFDIAILILMSIVMGYLDEALRVLLKVKLDLIPSLYRIGTMMEGHLKGKEMFISRDEDRQTFNALKHNYSVATQIRDEAYKLLNTYENSEIMKQTKGEVDNLVNDIETDFKKIEEYVMSLEHA